MSPHKAFNSFGKKKAIYSRRLKLSVAVRFFFADILIRQLCVYQFWRFHGNHKILCRFDQKSTFWVVLFSFLHQITEIQKHIHFVSTLAWFCVNFRYSWTCLFIARGYKMTDQMTSFDVVWRHYRQKWCNLVQPAQGFISLCLNRTKIKREGLLQAHLVPQLG